MIWQLYFWALCLLSTLVLVSLFAQPNWSIREWAEIFLSIAGLIGLYSFVYKKRLFSAMLWKAVLNLYVVLFNLNIIYYVVNLKDYFPLPDFLTTQTINSGKDVLISLFLSFPLLYALYMLSYSKKLGKSYIIGVKAKVKHKRKKSRR